jgi:queuosine precursor transporter
LDSLRARLDPAALSLIAAYALSIYLANWLLFSVGSPAGDGVRTIPVWPGVEAPSGVLAAGATFTLRDAVQRTSGLPASLIAVILGSLLTTVISPSAGFASGASFLIAEVLDLGVYTRLRRRFYLAVGASNVVGAVVDSLAFLTLAFGWTTAVAFAAPSALGKLEASLVTLGVLGLARRVSKGPTATLGAVRADTPTR